MSNAIIQNCAKDLRVSPGAISDTQKVQGGFNAFQQKVQENLQRGASRSEAVINTPPMITPEAATGGAQDKSRANEVGRMIQCVGDKSGLNPGVTSELKGMYRDAVNAERFRQDPSIINGLKNLFGG